MLCYYFIYQLCHDNTEEIIYLTAPTFFRLTAMHQPVMLVYSYCRARWMSIHIYFSSLGKVIRGAGGRYSKI